MTPVRLAVLDLGSTRISDGRVRVRLVGTSNPEGAATEAAAQAELLAQVLGAQIRFDVKPARPGAG